MGLFDLNKPLTKGDAIQIAAGIKIFEAQEQKKRDEEARIKAAVQKTNDDFDRIRNSILEEIAEMEEEEEAEREEKEQEEEDKRLLEERLAKEKEREEENKKQLAEIDAKHNAIWHPESQLKPEEALAYARMCIEKQKEMLFWKKALTYAPNVDIRLMVNEKIRLLMVKVATIWHPESQLNPDEALAYASMNEAEQAELLYWKKSLENVPNDEIRQLVEGRIRLLMEKIA